MAKLRMNCPRCGESWGIEEMSFNECDHCNYPNKWDEDEFDGHDYDEDDYDDVENMVLDKEADLANNEK